MVSLRKKKKRKERSIPQHTSLSKMLPKKKSFSCSICSMVVFIYDSICFNLYVICFDSLFFFNIIIATFSLICFFYPPWANALLVSALMITITFVEVFMSISIFLSVDLIHILHPKLVIILINLSQK